MKLKKMLFAAASLLALSTAAPAWAGEPHVDIRLVFGLPGVYVEPPPVVVYRAPRPPVVVVPDHRHYHPRIAHYHAPRYYEGRRFKEIQHRNERHEHKHRHRDDDRWERRGR
jgi:hypothetical protein